MAVDQIDGRSRAHRRTRRPARVQSDEQSGAHSIRELERIRDRNLAGIMQALEENDWGAGNTLKTQRERLDG